MPHSKRSATDCDVSLKAEFLSTPIEATPSKKSVRKKGVRTKPQWMIIRKTDLCSIDIGIPFKDPFAQAIHLGNSLNQAQELQARLWFRIGCIVNKNHNIGRALLANTIGVDVRVLKRAEKLAAIFGLSEKRFLADFRASKSTTFHSYLIKRIRRIKKNPAQVTSYIKKITDRASAFITAIKDDPSVFHENAGKLNRIRNMINRHIPVDVGIVDTVSLPYYTCTCCGAEPPVDGHELRILKQASMPEIEYPICGACAAVDKAPDEKLLLKMYAVYTINTSKFVTVAKRYMSPSR